MSALAQDPPKPDTWSINVLQKLLCNELAEHCEKRLNKLHVRPYVPCIIENTLQVRALYDTGADITCMSEAAFRQISVDQRPVKLQREDTAVTCASNSSVRPVGSYRMKIQVAGKSFEHIVQVFAKLNEAFIIGMDFIEKNLLYYNPANHQYHWDRQIGRAHV